VTRRGPGPRGVALVSGGSGAIGEAICRSLHDDGWAVAIGYVSRERAGALAASLHTDDVPSWPVPLDMRDSGSIRAGIAGLLADAGRVDAAVYNGGLSRTAPFVETTEEDWAAEIAVNYLGPVLATHLLLPAMLENERGSFVGITSEAAKLGDAAHAPYAAVKAALHAFFQTIVREYGRQGILANSVAPGPIDTPMLRYTFSSPEQAERAIGKLRRLVPVGRLGTPDEVAEAVRFLVSESSFVAGQQISVGGGVSMH
jgi:NAD(P)-dependent dehydrogenase (short-subunit alcohol dehydrogenase family)